MKNRILKSSVGLLVGGSVACLFAVLNTPVTASISPKFDAVRSGYIIAAAVQPLEVGTYGAMTAKAVVGDNLTPDHIPSFAAVKKFKEKIKGGALTGAEETKLRNETNTIVYSGTLHKDFSRTYAGRNNDAQITADAKDLKAAFAADKAKIRPELVKVYDAAKVDAAFTALNNLNIKSGLYQ
jgi:uncharacterized protein YfcZ (UPF0381/DUF406 family)